MIHTFTIKHQINAVEYGDFQKTPGTKSYKNKHNDTWKIENRMFEKNGLILRAYKYGVPERPDFFCYELFVNPAKVVGRNNVLEIYEPHMFWDFYEKFNGFICQYGIPLPSLEEWIAYRIDYTRDIHTEHVDLYIKLFQKADLNRYKFSTDKNNNQTRYRPGSLYCKCKNHTINFYDKANEIENSGGSEEAIAQAKDTLRIEVQCKKSKLDYIKRKYDLPDKGIANFLLRYDIATDVLTYYVGRLLGIGDYYKKNRAITMIKNSNLQKKTKDTMIAIIKDTSSQYSGIDKIKGKYDNLCKQQFKKLGMNLVSIDPNVKGIPMLKSIVELIAEVPES